MAKKASVKKETPKKKASLSETPEQPDIHTYIKPEKGSIINAAAHIEKN